jgi:hypothetical protein
VHGACSKDPPRTSRRSGGSSSFWRERCDGKELTRVMGSEPLRPLRPGDAAPDFGLPAVNRDVMGTTHEKLKTIGVETLAVVNTPPDRARLYFRYRQTRVLLAADPDAATHRAFGLPAIEIVSDEAATRWPERATMEQLLKVPVNPTGELPAPVNIFEAMEAVNKKEGFQPTEVDEKIIAAHGTQLAGHFLIDIQGIVRWAQAEAPERIGDLAKFPSDDEILAAARALPQG